MLLASGNPFERHEEVLYLQPLIQPKCLDISPPCTGGCSEGLGAFLFFFQTHTEYGESSIKQSPILYKSFVLMPKIEFG